MDLWKKVKRAGNTRRKIAKGREEILRRGFELGERILQNSRSRANTYQRHDDDTQSFTARAPVVLETVIVNNNLFVSNTPHAYQPPSTSSAVTECFDVGSNEPADSVDLGVCLLCFCVIRATKSAILFSHVLLLADIDASVSEKPNTTDTVVYEESDDENETEFERNEKFRSKFRKWAVEFKITHSALKSLMQIINTSVHIGENSNILPDDPRTLLQTPQFVNIMPMCTGEYWHCGLANSLKHIFRNLSESIMISLNINIDGLPIFKGSKTVFWPILFKIKEMPHIEAMVIGIYSGPGKCLEVEQYLTPFVDEFIEIMERGITINSHKITVYINCFICDSPARAFVKRMCFTFLSLFAS